MEYISNCPICNNSNFENTLNAKDTLVSQEEFSIVKCENCGFRFTNPRPNELEIGKYYESEDYDSHSENSSLFGQLYSLLRARNIDYKLNVIRNYKPLRGKIFDYGCGVGAFLKKAEKMDFVITGYEPNAKANKIASENGVNIVDFKEIKIDYRKYFDVITLWHVLEHVHDLNGVVSILNKCLKEDGIMVVAVPNIDSYDALIYSNKWAGLDVPRHLYHFNRNSIESFFNNYGLKTIGVHPLKMDSYYISLLSEGKSIFKYPKAIINGFISNFRAQKTFNYSSLIYILQKEKQ